MSVLIGTDTVGHLMRPFCGHSVPIESPVHETTDSPYNNHHLDCLDVYIDPILLIPKAPHH
ncbi:unnamed protein product [Oppiella nova]|uniref:Uncharacterized protein n=1 Tax=Oppiella nova TaxID=334625 RepID=A0A7R9MRQ2_9ACAR|nr:unnamed protein product [Oppiella nova]CAG2182441.1 unnamed protein product [Oppiella nova]